VLASLPNAAEPRQVPRSLGKFPALTLPAASVAQAEPATSGQARRTAESTRSISIYELPGPINRQRRTDHCRAGIGACFRIITHASLRPSPSSASNSA
jgi:hypothetical protein